MKANSAGPIVRAIASRGCGADVVSGAELGLALRCGISADDIVYSGVAKSDDELDLAIFVWRARHPRDSGRERRRDPAHRRARRAPPDANVRVAIRINPGLDIDELDTHTHIATGHDEAKFGVARADARRARSQP